MKVWITKYALTRGVFQLYVVDLGNGIVRSSSNALEHYHKRDWHLAKESAISRAEEMRKKKISSLKKQIEKLENMKFE